MSILDASIRESLWHSMRQDLSRFVPQIISNELLMCPCCGRFLTQENFSLEHIVPRQALKNDPIEARMHKDTPTNVRAGTILLCKKPIKYKGNIVYANGCNSWKGSWFDGSIREALGGVPDILRQKKKGANHIVALLCAGYIAMVHKYGFSAVLMQSGLLMRQQFFSPRRFLPALPVMCQLVMLGDCPPFDSENLDPWIRPFTFEVDMKLGICRVGFRNTIMMLPVSADPGLVRPTSLIIVPNAYSLRPRFDTFFE